MKERRGEEEGKGRTRRARLILPDVRHLPKMRTPLVRLRIPRRRRKGELAARSRRAEVDDLDNVGLGGGEIVDDAELLGGLTGGVGEKVAM